MPVTPWQYLENLCLIASDEPTTPSVSLKQAEQSLLDCVRFDETTWLDAQAYGFENILTPRCQLQRILKNTAMHVDANWNGQEAIHDACRLFENSISPEELGSERVARASVFPMVAQAYSMCILPEIALCRPHDRPASVSPKKGKLPVWHRQVRRVEEFSNALQLRIAKTWIEAQRLQLHATFSKEELQDRRLCEGLDVGVELVAAMAREAALELNLLALRKLLAAAPVVFGEERTFGPALVQDRVSNLLNQAFAQGYGNPTHLIVGPKALLKLGAADLLTPINPEERLPKPDRFAGVTVTSFRLKHTDPTLKLWVSNLWSDARPDALLLVRCLPHNLEGPLAYCPYRWGAHLESGDLIRSQVTHEGALDVVEPAYAVQTRLE